MNLLKRLLRPEHPRVEVRSVDGFQGGEKEAIVLSLVRSNPGQKRYECVYRVRSRDKQALFRL